MKLVCGTDLGKEGIHCCLPVKHDGQCLPYLEEHKPVLRTQSRRASLAEAVANTTIGFCISWIATLTAMHLVGFTLTFHQLWWYTWFMTGVSVVRSYYVRRLWNSEWWKAFKIRRLR